MSEWTIQTLHYGNATIIVRRPVLTDRERAKREQQVKSTVQSVMRDYYKREEVRRC